MKLNVLNVAYAFAPVSRDAIGGAEQIVATLDRALVAAGHRSIVIARDDSQVAGELVPIEVPAGEITDETRALVHARQRQAIRHVLARVQVDLVHLHGIDCLTYLPRILPTIVTLHLPISWYPNQLFDRARHDVQFVCVSQAQRGTLTQSDAELIPNGVDVNAFARTYRRRNFALVLSRVCPEKNLHAALQAGKQAGVPVLVAGEVFPYAEHQRYFDEVFAPQLDPLHRFIGSADFTRKRRLLAAAQCVLIPSLAPETSSLVAMEALASGTPVVAYRSGALAEIVDDGLTGFLVNSPEEMAAAIPKTRLIESATCRQIAHERFSSETMAHGYFQLYRKVARQEVTA